MTTNDVAVATPPALGVPAGEARINFAAHQVRGGPHGAREDFERMVAQLVRAVRPGARMIAANPGDWGIDVLVGDLAGSVVVWQSKFFMPEVSKDHQGQIRESFESAMKHATDHAFTITQWVLCVPSSMDGPTAKWWDGWKKRKSREYSVIIELWDETELSGLLISPDAASVRRHFYEPMTLNPATAAAATIIELGTEESARLDTALFVRQLREAGHVEVDGSKRQFFNAELMAREVADKGVASEVAALSHADALVHSLWEEHFNEACRRQGDPRLPGLHKTVMGDIRAQHATVGAGLAAGSIHTSGLMHRVVDARRAGWIREWRSVAGDHKPSDSTSQTGATSEEPTSACGSAT